MPFQDAYLSLLGMQTVKGGGFLWWLFCVCFLLLVFFPVYFICMSSILGPFYCWVLTANQARARTHTLSLSLILHNLNVFDAFNKMGLLEESSNKLSTVSPLSSSAAGVWGFCLGGWWWWC